MTAPGKPMWQRVTALVSLSTGGAVTGFSFVPGAVADLTTPTSMPIRLMALEKSVQPPAPDDALLRSAVVNVATYYLKMAEGRTPAEMEQIIWQKDSLDGVDHGPSCAAFASLTLELGAQVVGQQSWVTGGSTYPWPLHTWADVRVDPNPSSLGITSLLQDAQANHRWHPLGDGYQPMPGDWVLFDGHVEVVTKYTGGILDTIGGDSGPNLSVNAHQYAGPLGAQGVAGFVNNGRLLAAAGGAGRGSDPVAAPRPQEGTARSHGPAASGEAAIPGAGPGAGPVPGAHAPDAHAPGAQAPGQGAQAPGAQAPGSGAVPAGGRPAGAMAARPGRRGPERAHPQRRSRRPGLAGSVPRVGADVPGTGAAWSASPSPASAPGSAAVPGLPDPVRHRHGAPPPAPAAPQSQAGRSLPAPPSGATVTQQAFIASVAPGAIAAQRTYGVPAAVTIAQAIEESGWGQSGLAVRDHNLFGIKGQGPAGSDMLPTQEFENGQMVNRTAIFRVYNNVAESIDDHGKLLATSGYYRQAMADRLDPDRFAASLTGIYATDPAYGDKLIRLMRQYDLYRYGAGQAAAPSGPAAPGTAAPAASAGGASIPGLPARPAPAWAQRVRPGRPAHHRRHVRHRDGVRPVRTAPPAQSPPPQSQPAQPNAAPSPSATPAPAPARPTPVPQPAQPPPVPQPVPQPVPPAAAPPAAARPAPAPRPAPSRPGGPAPGRPPAPPRSRPTQTPPVDLVSDIRIPAAGRPTAGNPSRLAGAPVRRYRHHLPLSVRNAFHAAARGPISRAESLYRDVASHSGIRWELLAACDWMQCEARPRYSPVHGERLGTLNPDGTAYHTKSEALEQVADDLADLAGAVYQIDLTAPGLLSVHDLANAFAAFRWGGLLRLHRTSAMEFPYSVAGLTEHHTSMRWPAIDEPNAPDRPGGRFHRPFGAVPVVLGLNYPAVD